MNKEWEQVITDRFKYACKGFDYEQAVVLGGILSEVFATLKTVDQEVDKLKIVNDCLKVKNQRLKERENFLAEANARLHHELSQFSRTELLEENQRLKEILIDLGGKEDAFQERGGWERINELETENQRLQEANRIMNHSIREAVEENQRLKTEVEVLREDIIELQEKADLWYRSYFKEADISRGLKEEKQRLYTIISKIDEMKTADEIDSYLRLIGYKAGAGE
jgi:GTPase SAR1 family protein